MTMTGSASRPPVACRSRGSACWFPRQFEDHHPMARLAADIAQREAEIGENALRGNIVFARGRYDGMNVLSLGEIQNACCCLAGEARSAMLRHHGIAQGCSKAPVMVPEAGNADEGARLAQAQGEDTEAVLGPDGAIAVKLRPRLSFRQHTVLQPAADLRVGIKRGEVGEIRLVDGREEEAGRGEGGMYRHPARSSAKGALFPSPRLRRGGVRGGGIFPRLSAPR
jgi:hypothetical protein